MIATFYSPRWRCAAHTDGAVPLGAEVWLTESDSVCHQGVFGVTNAYLNSLWLVNRLGVLANHNVSVMARQSLVGYNYSLLGNWPVEVCAPPPQTL